MHPRGPPLYHNMAATVAEAEAVGVGLVDAEDAVNTVETVSINNSSVFGPFLL